MELQRDGGALLSAAKKHCSSNRADIASASTLLSSDEKKYRLVFQSLERRWHCLWIKSLERQYVLEDYIKQIESVSLKDSAIKLHFFDDNSKAFSFLNKFRKHVHFLRGFWVKVITRINYPNQLRNVDDSTAVVHLLQVAKTSATIRRRTSLINRMHPIVAA